MAATSGLLYLYNHEIGNSSFNDALDDIPSTGGAPINLATEVGAADVMGGLAIDAAAGVYFITTEPPTTDDTYIYEEHFGQPLQFSTPVGGGPVSTNLNVTGDFVGNMALNAADDILYYSAGNSFYEEVFAGPNYTGAATDIKLATFAGLPDTSTNSTANSTTDSQGSMVFDQADHTAYFAAPVAKISYTFTSPFFTKPLTIDNLTNNYIYKVSGVTAGATAGSLTSQASILNLGGPNGQLPFTDGEIERVALDSKTDTLYITTQAAFTNAAEVTGSNTAGIYAYNIATGQLTTVFSEKVTEGTSPALSGMTDIVIDPVTGDYFVEDYSGSGTAIYKGNVDNIGVAPTLFLTDPTANTLAGLAIDDPPTVSSAAVTAIDGNTGKTTGTVTTADTVTISVTFNENVNVTGTPKLALNDGGSATYVSGGGTNILVFTYKPASGDTDTTTLKSTGLSGGAITDSVGTAADLTNAAATFTGVSVDTTPPDLTVNTASPEAVQGDGAATLLVSDTITDSFSPTQLTSATISISNSQAGDELSLPGVSGGTVDGGAITVTGNDTSTLTLTGAASVSEYETLLASVTYQGTGADSTTVGHPTRTIDWKVDDGVLSSNLATSTVTIDRPPVVTNEPTIVVTTGIGGTTTSTPSENVLASPNASDPDGDTLTLVSVDGSAANIGNPVVGTDGTLTLNSDGSFTYLLNNAATQTDSFSYTISDGTTTTTGTLNFNPCYCAGSLILTEHGEVAVEALAIDDRVVTAGGELRSIVWIGHRELDIAKHRWPLEVLPVRVRKGAFGANSPRRDLWLSPQHAVFVDGVLIPIIRLANGASIAQQRVERVSYWHVELESHDVLLAEGLPAESFLDCGTRQGFANYAGFIELHPTFKPLSWDDACAPLKVTGPEVESLRARLLVRAVELGFRRCRDPDLRVRADGQEVRPQFDQNGVYVFSLANAARELKLLSRSFRPADSDGAETSDRRHLGVAVRSLVLDGAVQDLASLDQGWHALEGEVGGVWRWRWTDGCAALPASARTIAVTIGEPPICWVEGRPPEPPHILAESVAVPARRGEGVRLRFLLPVGARDARLKSRA